MCRTRKKRPGADKGRSIAVSHQKRKMLYEMIKYQMHSSRMFPRIYCDGCDRPIGNADAVVLWNDKGEVAYAHLGKCARKFSNKDAWPCAERLLVFLTCLISNTRIKAKQLDGAEFARARMLAVGSLRKLNRGVK